MKSISTYFNKAQKQDQFERIKDIILGHVAQEFNGNRKSFLASTKIKLFEFEHLIYPGKKLPYPERIEHVASKYPEKIRNELKDAMYNAYVQRSGMDYKVINYFAGKLRPLDDIFIKYAAKSNKTGNEFLLGFFELISKQWKTKDTTLSDLIGANSQFISDLKKLEHLPYQIVLANIQTEAYKHPPKYLKESKIPKNLRMSHQNFMALLSRVYGNRDVATEAEKVTGLKGYDAIEKYFKDKLKAEPVIEKRIDISKDFFLKQRKFYGLGYPLLCYFTNNKVNETNQNCFRKYYSEEYWFGNPVERANPETGSKIASLFRGTTNNTGDSIIGREKHTLMMYFGYPEYLTKESLVDSLLGGEINTQNFIYRLMIQTKASKTQFAEYIGFDKNDIHKLLERKPIGEIVFNNFLIKLNNRILHIDDPERLLKIKKIFEPHYIKNERLKNPDEVFNVKIKDAQEATYNIPNGYSDNLSVVEDIRMNYDPEILAKLQGTIEQVGWANSGAKTMIGPDDIIKLGTAITQLQETAGMSDEDVVKGLNGFDIENFRKLKSYDSLPSVITENSKSYYLTPLLQNLGVPESHHEPLAEAIYKLHTMKGDLEYFLEGGYSGDYQDPDQKIIEQVKKKMGPNKKKDRREDLLPPEREL